MLAGLVRWQPPERAPAPLILTKQVKVKMSCEAFLKNNRGIDDGADLPPDFMSALYQRIVTNEIKV